MPSAIQIDRMHDYFDRFSEHMEGQISGSGGSGRFCFLRGWERGL
ncbi:hypothetical protein ACI48J_14320 [Paenibacillus chitinolyticus]